MVAADDPSVAAVVLLAGPARTFRETMRYQNRYRIENDPAIPPADREAALAEAMRQQEANVAASTEAWRRSIQDRDPLPTARRLRMPVLILHGLTDRAVEPEDARSWSRRSATAATARVTAALPGRQPPLPARPGRRPRGLRPAAHPGPRARGAGDAVRLAGGDAALTRPSVRAGAQFHRQRASTRAVM